MKILNKQKRTTTIWHFLGIAAIPLLLAFFGGFSLGRVGKTDNAQYQKKYQDAQIVLDSVEEAMGRQKTMVLAIVESLERMEDLKDLDRDLTDAFNNDAEDLIREIRRDQKELLDEMEDDLEDLDVEYDGKSPLDSVNLMMIEIAQDYINTRSLLRINNEDRLELSKDKDCPELCESSIQKLTEDLDALQEKLDEEKQSNRILQIAVDAAKFDLKRCMAETGQESLPIDNSANVAIIKAEIDFVRNQILPDLRGKVLGKGDTDILREKIQARLTTIAETLQLIE